MTTPPTQDFVVEHAVRGDALRGSLAHFTPLRLATRPRQREYATQRSVQLCR